MFDALAKLSASIPDAYQRASEFGDLHLGDLHLIRINGQLLCTLYLILIIYYLNLLRIVKKKKKNKYVLQVVHVSIR